MDFQFNDGGRAAAGYKGLADDCMVRAMAIAMEIPYQSAYDMVNQFAKTERKRKKSGGKSSARTGVYKSTIRRIMSGLGWKWVPTMQIGQGCKVHLRKDELPPGRLIVSVSKHMVAVIDGVIHDNHNPDRGGSRCVYGYFFKENS